MRNASRSGAAQALTTSLELPPRHRADPRLLPNRLARHFQPAPDRRGSRPARRLRRRAPLALTPFSAAAVVQLAATMHFELFAGRRILLPLALLLAICIALPMFQLAATFAAPLRMLRRATQCGNARLWLMAVTLPLAW